MGDSHHGHQADKSAATVWFCTPTLHVGTPNEVSVWLKQCERRQLTLWVLYKTGLQHCECVKRFRNTHTHAHRWGVLGSIEVYAKWHQLSEGTDHTIRDNVCHLVFDHKHPYNCYSNIIQIWVEGIVFTWNRHLKKNDFSFKVNSLRKKSWK